MSTGINLVNGPQPIIANLQGNQPPIPPVDPVIQVQFFSKVKRPEREENNDEARKLAPKNF